MDATPLTVETLHQHLGDAPFVALVDAFYAGIPGDPILGPMYDRNDLEGARQRLADFLIFRCGGPPRYIETRGHPMLRGRHAPFTIDVAARDRWVELMRGAFPAAGWSSEAEAVLRPFLESVATFLINRASNPAPGFPLAEPRRNA
jgi:hemoglobin